MRFPSFFTRPLVRWALPVLVLLGAGGGWLLTRSPAPEPARESSRPAGVFRPTKEQLAGLKIAEVQKLTFRSMLTTDGNIAFNDDAMTPVFSPYTGRVSRVVARLGDVVKKGAPLMAIEASEFVQGQGDVATTRAALDTARLTEKRQHELFDAGAGAMKDWRQAQSDLVAAEAAWKAARGRLHILGKNDTEIDALEKAPAGMTEALVTAPIAGTVTQRQVGTGQYLQSAATGAATPSFTIGDLSTVWLVANVREGDAPALRVGQPAEVTVLALPGKTFKANIAWVGSAVDPVTHRLPVRATVQNPDGELKPQMFASFSIATSTATEAPAVPQGALIYEGETTRAFVVAADGSIAGRPVRAGRSRDGMIEILSGLKVGEKVVSAGTLFIDRAAEGN
ncbi:MAG: efflux RND transporter periplasmic adaptor subunit [Rhodocyclaceae bacterium]|nr:efflux RND transporter periplasmic adaptor subunit [Rhodocyclaceae bacterium]